MHRIVCFAALLLLPGTLPAQEASRPFTLLPTFSSERQLMAFLDSIAATRPTEARRQVAASCSARPKIGRRGRSAGPETVILSGRVVNMDGEPIASAQVTLEGTNTGTVTTPQGTFRLMIGEVARRRTVVLQVQTIGFSSQQLRLSVSPRDSVPLTVPLCEASLELDEIVVTATAFGSDNVTNVQHAGADEGGIVKVHGDYLLVLRRGRLFSLRLDSAGTAPIAAVDASGPDIPGGGTWYDELLVSGNNAIVIGYSYARGGTEVGIFTIEDDGRLTYRSTYNLRSADYYSSRNYASRLIGSRLVLYMPVPLILRNDPADTLLLPGIRRWQPGRQAAFRPLVTARRIYRPGVELPWRGLTLHTVVACEVVAAELDCEATAVLGPPGRVFYVSPAAVYVWSGAGAGRDEPASMLYRLALEGGGASAVRATGNPVDQFSFLEAEDGRLNVLVTGAGRGEGMWNAEGRHGGLALLQLLPQDFGRGADPVRASAYRPLAAPASAGHYALHNRFVGEHLLYGMGSGWGRTATGGGTLHAVNWKSGESAELPLPHGVDRIEVMGRHAVVIGADGEDLHFSGIALSDLPSVRQRHVQRGAAQAETRSHGFFYRDHGTEPGIIGIPLARGGRPGYRQLVDGAAGVVFLANEGSRFRPLGELRAAVDVPADDACRASCIDWYGNARPLFLRGRIFALMGYELVEGRLEHGDIREIGRTSFFPEPRLLSGGLK